VSYRLALDDHGAPILLAPVAAGEADRQEKVKAEQERRAQSSAARRRDSVVDAARTLEDLSPAGVEAFVRRRWRGDRAVTAEDFASFSADARAQRVHDVADAIDHRIRKAVEGRAGSKQVHVSLPRGVGAKSLASLDPEEMAVVLERLRDRGWSNQQIHRHGVRRLDKAGEMRKLIGESDG
jgi:hypothetical protein